MRFAAALLLSLLALRCAAAGGLVTIVDGEALVLRDTQRFAAAEGLRLRADDILRTGETTRLVRVELEDGRLVDLGPATQLMLLPRALTRDGAPAAYLLQGWAKLSGGPKDLAMLATPRIDAMRIGGTLIAGVTAEATALFAETGTAELQARRRDPRAASMLPLGEGDALVLPAAGTASRSRLLPPALRPQVPHAFVDTLPRRAERFASRVAAPVAPAEVSYAEIAPWVNAEPALRAAFVQRLTPRAHDGAFRQALVAEMRLHPEWQPVLFPPPPPKPKPPMAMPAPLPAPTPMPTTESPT